MMFLLFSVRTCPKNYTNMFHFTFNSQKGFSTVTLTCYGLFKTLSCGISQKLVGHFIVFFLIVKVTTCLKNPT